MKIEKIAENKVRITLTIDELSQRQITLKDIEQDSVMAQDLFLDLLEESDLNDEFIAEDSQLFVEASSDNENLFVVTITKIDYMPEISKYTVKNKSQSKKTLNKPKHNSPDYTVASSIYKFSSLDLILDLSSKIKEENIFMGTNSLYKHKENYFLVFGNASIKNKKFIKTFAILSEYASEYYASDLYKTLINEKCQLIIKSRALQQLAKIS
ncbi:MAG: adaptor protein MecA [Clostridia bacterium]|nr:adaptor protein MecA [Clostridia bacterium]MDD4375201.1 adaptor protein MecA [Clostridia bacterium]